MNRVTLVLCLLLSVFFVGCGKNHEHAADKSAKPAHEAGEHVAPHGGKIVDIAGGDAHLEFLHDERAGTVNVYVLDATLKPKSITGAPVLNVKADAGPKQLTMTAVIGAAVAGSQWSVQDDALKGHSQATLRLEIDGKTYTPDVPPHH